MITGNHEKIAFDVTKEIVIARLSNCQHAVDKEHGEKSCWLFWNNLQ